MLDPNTVKKDFPFFRYHPEMVYLDAAATALKPQTVIEAEKEYLEQYPANIARGLYPLAERATEKFEAVRAKAARFIGAESHREIIFTSGTTASINLAASLLVHTLNPASNIVTTAMEHHSNFLPWKEAAQRNGATFRTLPLAADGTLDLEAFQGSVDEQTRVVAFSAVSNVLGTINPVRKIVAAVKKINPQAVVLVDAAQAIGHAPLSVAEWGADFVAFSAHKMFGTTGVGVLYGRSSVLETLSPVTFGGGMVLDACGTETLYKEIPHRFEAGTPNIGGIIALGAAIDYIERIGVAHIRTHETALTTYALEKLSAAFGDTVRVVGPPQAKDRGGIIAFSFAGLHPHDIAHCLGENNICVRGGEHCAAPLHRAFDLAATTRLSFSIYNSETDIDRFIEGLKKVQNIFIS